MSWSICEVLVEIALVGCVACTVATTNLQYKQTAEVKSAVSAKSFH
jgi:hypothetical protein